MRSRCGSTLARHHALHAHWMALCDTLGIADRAAHQGRQLVRQWDRIPRYYHDSTHLLACLRHLEQVRDQVDSFPAVALALWFHDAVYWPRRHDNEARSAQWAASFVRGHGLNAGLAEHVAGLILQTAHTATPAPGDAHTVLDIDLAILGQNPLVYADFERRVRQEYRWVPWPAYVQGRSAVLQSFLGRTSIYNTAYFQQRFEAAARCNLAHALAQLQAGGYLPPKSL